MARDDQNKEFDYTNKKKLEMLSRRKKCQKVKGVFKRKWVLKVNRNCIFFSPVSISPRATLLSSILDPLGSFWLR